MSAPTNPPGPQHITMLPVKGEFDAELAVGLVMDALRRKLEAEAAERAEPVQP